MRIDLKKSLISTSFYLLILTTILHLPLAAMNDEKERESVTRGLLLLVLSLLLQRVMILDSMPIRVGGVLP